MEWSETSINLLRQLWSEGHSTAEIGRRMGISKNAVVGKAHRLNLSARPSPIRRMPDGETRRRAPVARRVTGPTLAPLAAVTNPPMPQAAAPSPSGGAGVAVPAPRPAVRVVQTPQLFGRVTACCWPLGEPGTKSFRFCGGESQPGKPYCAEHASLAYVKIRDRREDAA